MYVALHDGEHALFFSGDTSPLCISITNKMYITFQSNTTFII